MDRKAAKIIFVSAALGAALVQTPRAQAQQIEIIHTNDLHSHFESGDDDSRGGYAAVKATIDRLKAQAQAQGIETLTLDAGDFSEGTPFYLADNGEDSWRIVQEMGYDAIAIGNHDWLVGPEQMNEIAEAVAPQTPLLSANLKVDSRFHALRRYIQPDAQFTRAGLKIGVFGLSTNEIEYSWRITDGHIDDPNDVGQQEARKLRKRDDIVIALTHLGVTADESLAANVAGIDLIVGGHSHTVLEQPVWVQDPDGHNVPIVQTGAHGMYVGDLLINYDPAAEPDKRVTIVHYNLVPVFKVTAQDPVMLSRVEGARQDLEAKYGPAWLHEVLGVASAPWESPQEHPTPWGNFYVDSIRESVGADLGIDDSAFFGDNQPSGPITREEIMNFYPRVFDLTQPMGWTVWTIHVPGWLLDILIRDTVGTANFFNFSNCEFDVKDSNGNIDVSNIRVGGQALDLGRDYRVAVTEGIGLGAQDIQWLLKIFFRPEDSGIPVWTAVEDKIHRSIQQNGTIVLQSSDSANWLPKTRHWTPGRFSEKVFTTF